MKEIVGKHGLQILTFWRSLQTGKMSSSSRNGGRQTANAGNVRSRDPLCRSRGKNTGCLISLMLNLNDSNGRIDVTETFLICLEGTELGVRKGA